MSTNRIFVEADLLTQYVQAAAASAEAIMSHQYSFREPSRVGVSATEAFDRAIHQHAWRCAQIASGTSKANLTFASNVQEAGTDLSASDEAASAIISQLQDKWDYGAKL